MGTETEICGVEEMIRRAALGDQGVRVAGHPYTNKVRGGLWHVVSSITDPLRIVVPGEFEAVCLLYEFDSDGGSIPELVVRMARAVGSEIGRWSYPIPFCFHDAVYEFPFIFFRELPVHDDGFVVPVTRKTADRLLKLGLRAENAGPRGTRAKLGARHIAQGIAVFGIFAWEAARLRDGDHKLQPWMEENDEQRT